MSFIHLSLISIGSLFLAVPIALHLAMRQKARHQIFPALRFLQLRQMTNKRRLQLRQWLLLFLRCAAVLLLALALARPSVASSQLSQWLVTGGQGILLLVLVFVTIAAFVYRRGWLLIVPLFVLILLVTGSLIASSVAIVRGESPVFLGDSQAPIAAVVLIDTSPRMSYLYQNQTRLEAAKETGRWLILQFPQDSDVAVIDAESNVVAFAVDAGAALKTVDSTQVTFRRQPWTQLLEQSLELLQQSDLPRKELYIVSDLTRQTWGDSITAGFAQKLSQAGNVTVQLIDVGVTEPRNDSLNTLELADEMLTSGGAMNLRVSVERDGPPSHCTLELSLETDEDRDPIFVDGELQLPETSVRRRVELELEPGIPASTNFQLPALPFGTHHGYVEIVGDDALPLDNRKFFTVHVRSAWPVLIVSDDRVTSDLLNAVLSPTGFAGAKFDCKVVDTNQFKNERLDNYAAVALLDPPPLDEFVWETLQDYVEAGGGLAIFLGRNAESAVRFNSDAALEVMPGAIDRQWRDDEGLFFTIRDFEHPMLRIFSDARSSIPWDSMPIFRHWVLGDLAESTTVLLPFSNNKPAIVERLLGKGRAIVVTTPVSEIDGPGRDPWNQLLNSTDPWPYLMLLDRLFVYLVQSQDAPLNYLTGQVAQVMSPSTDSQRWPLLTPRGDWQDVASLQGQLRVPFTDEPGIYRLKIDLASETPRGFSVNLAGEETRLDRITTEQLEQIFGKDAFRLARERSEVVREIDQARMGREFYPFLLPVLALVLGLEFILANRFYSH